MLPVHPRPDRGMGRNRPSRPRSRPAGLAAARRPAPRPPRARITAGRAGAAVKLAERDPVGPPDARAWQHAHPTEQRITDLAASGHTNPEIAATLYISIKTVEANLTRIYRKLGARSRTDLARHHLH